MLFILLVLGCGFGQVPGASGRIRDASAATDAVTLRAHHARSHRERYPQVAPEAIGRNPNDTVFRRQCGHSPETLGLHAHSNGCDPLRIAAARESAT